MRLLLKLKIAPKEPFLSLNYNYPLSAAIYKLLKLGSAEFSEFLHSVGYKDSGKTYKLFTFALRFSKFQIINNSIKLLEPKAELFISSPLIDNFIKNFVIGTFTEQKIEIIADDIKTSFSIEQMESLPEIQFSNKMKFVALSPLIISTKKEFNGNLKQYYFRYYDSIDEINRVLNVNLNNKYRILNNKDYKGDGVKIRWDKNYITLMEKKKKRLTKKITVKKGKTSIDLIGNQLPFEIEGDPVLIKVGYECGFCEKNGLGFGFVALTTTN